MQINRLFRTRLPQTLIDESREPGRLMKKRLTAIDLIAFGVGATIGSGIFALTGTAAAGQPAQARDWLSTPIINFVLSSPLGRDGAGPAIAISFIVAALACGLAAMCYAELSAMIPVAGSAYTFAYAAAGEVVAWIIGWNLILEYSVGNIAVAVSWSDYFLYLLHGLTGLKIPLWLSTDTGTALSRIASAAAGSHQSELYSSLALPGLWGHPFAINLPAALIVAAVTWVLVVGIQESALVNCVMVFIKLGVVLFFIAYGWGYVKPENWVPFAPSGLAGIMGGAAIVFFSFIGFDAVSSMAEETKKPQRDLPAGMLGSLIICTILYAVVSLVVTGILPYKSYVNDAAPVATALSATGNPLAQIIIAGGALAGMTSVLLVFQLGQPRIFMAMARDGLLPSVFSRLHSRFRTPFVTTIITGVLVGVPALFMDIGQAAELTNIGTLTAFILVCAGVLILRKKEPDRPRHFKCPLVPSVPVAGMVACFILMLSLPVVTWVRFVVWTAVGFAIYFGYGYRKSLLATAVTAGDTAPVASAAADK